MKLIFENWRRFLNEQEKKPIHIFFDMDGVLVDFAGSLANRINDNLDKARSGAGAEDIHPQSPSNRKNLQKLVDMNVRQITPEQLEEINFKKDNKEERSSEEKIIGKYVMSLVSKDEQIWRNMGKIPGADEMIEAAEQVAGLKNVYILSSPVGEASERAKIAWVQDHFPGRFPNERLILTGEKGQVLEKLGIIERKEVAILIDDRSKYVKQFQQAGGQTIHHSPPGSASVSDTISKLKGPWEWKEVSKLESGFGLILKVNPPANLDEIISAAQQKYSNILPEGEEFTKINKFHVTLISGKDYKSVSDEQKQNIVQSLEEGLPEAAIDTSQVFLATREMEGRKTLYLKIQNSPEFNKALEKVLGASWPEKYMHVSIANVHGGDSFKSVGDINVRDEGEQKNIVPAAQQQKKKKTQQQAPQARVEIPNEIKPLGGILRASMKDVASIYPNLKRVKDNERALQGIVNGVLRNKLNLSDEQVDAILGTL